MFEANVYSVQEKKRKIDFQDGDNGDHPGVLIRTILAIFDLQVTPNPVTKFRISWLFESEEECKIYFSRWTPWRSVWISDRNYFSCF